MMPLHKTSLELPGEKSIKAAVSVIVYSPATASPQILLIKRTDYEGHHSGQISFPGGKADTNDLVLYNTAVRETIEEIGVSLKKTEFLGTLTPLNIRVSNFDVAPFVFYIDKEREFISDPYEVQYLIPCYLTALLDDDTCKTTHLNINGHEIQAPFFDIENQIVWGATSMILSEFKEILNRVERKNPGVISPGL